MINFEMIQVPPKDEGIFKSKFKCKKCGKFACYGKKEVEERREGRIVIALHSWLTCEPCEIKENIMDTKVTVEDKPKTILGEME